MPPLRYDTQMRDSCWTCGNSPVQVQRVMVKDPLKALGSIQGFGRPSLFTASSSGIMVFEYTFSTTNLISGDTLTVTWTVTLQKWGLQTQKSSVAAPDVALLSLLFISTLQKAVFAVNPVRISQVSSAFALAGLSVRRDFGA